mmetsp:Transcript_74613/g.177609  ORF Transcript_74613/g.177609 Transcript_74613/m.177609 type:complete len:217 (-) Transcript_74613:1193-1843(-)
MEEPAQISGLLRHAAFTSSVKQPLQRAQGMHVAARWVTTTSALARDERLEAGTSALTLPLACSHRLQARQGQTAAVSCHGKLGQCRTRRPAGGVEGLSAVRSAAAHQKGNRADCLEASSCCICKSGSRCPRLHIQPPWDPSGSQVRRVAQGYPHLALPGGGCKVQQSALAKPRLACSSVQALGTVGKSLGRREAGYKSGFRCSSRGAPAHWCECCG